jgi:hypothetical protein
VKRSDLTILLAVVAVLGIAAFWLLLLSPKRDQDAKLASQANQLRAAVAEQQELASFARRARVDFDTDYRRLVVLGKAVPADSDTPSLLVEIQRLADESGVGFQSIELSDTGSSAEAGQVTTPPPLVAPGSTESSSGTSASQPTAQPSSPTSASSTTATDPAGTRVRGDERRGATIASSSGPR